MVRFDADRKNYQGCFDFILNQLRDRNPESHIDWGTNKPATFIIHIHEGQQRLVTIEIKWSIFEDYPCDWWPRFDQDILRAADVRDGSTVTFK